MDLLIMESPPSSRYFLFLRYDILLSSLFSNTSISAYVSHP
jgi:hypothetical protein